MNATDSLPATGSVLMTVTGALALIILLLVVLAWAARRSGFARRLNDAQGNMALVATQSLGPRERLVLVDVGEQRLVLGVTASQVTCLATQARPENAPQASAPATTFPQLLEKLRQKYRPGGEQ
ncbi:flagellar biosynthetic protein FliO [Enterobacter cloacae subsp. cloacae]|uniref:flagellar biosynthetic protein FliO n=1 Tax=Enterobacter cloacae TaxID=550 RepID=UPI001D035C2B|nr:flagellar biosynthetic protein FliO [Enterobacter cloacae]MCU6310082.1 flagellar biosynthetic protein FliO [Enterobacter cloacae]UDF99349.1 flagellar biosynthetic protein FliO [Enterobacter cloacae]WLD30596.1 flagellar biosynthetic protein FliO [Enterobacter cloacae subsp. cloacae]